MAILEIRTFGDPVLRQKAPPVERITDDHRRLVSDMIDTMREAPGVGLAGPQVGVLARVFVYEVEDDVGAIFNPVIVSRSRDMVEEEEGCLSLPGLLFPVTRHFEIRLEGLDENGNAIVRNESDLLARVFQHEVDHLDGVLFIDRLPGKVRRKAMRELTRQSLGLADPAASAHLASAEEIL
jgi:peptide deformylase